MPSQSNSRVADELAHRASAAASRRDGWVPTAAPRSWGYGKAAVDVDLGDGRMARIFVTVTGDDPTEVE